jgi:ferredoxin-nitrite reductase
MADTSATEPIYCPGLFEPAASGDRWLLRLRTPGGLVNYAQAQAIHAIAQASANAKLAGDSTLAVTNRGNLQFSAAKVPTAQLLQHLQSLGLAAPVPQLDRFRNIMASPTAGIDPLAVIDTRALVGSIDRYISNEPQLAQLSAKFSIGIDGGESVSIRQRPNDLCFVASHEGLRLLWRTPVGQADAGLVWDNGIEAVAAIAHWYLQQSTTALRNPNPHQRSQRTRLRQFLTTPGIKDLQQTCLQAGAKIATGSLPAPAPPQHQHLGVHPQSQAGYFYVGVALPLGELTLEQWQGLRVIAQQYGSGQLRLSPWQNVILPDISAVDKVLTALTDLDLKADHRDPAGWIAACRGLRCSSGETDSPQHARRLIQAIDRLLQRPLQIHISGCSKGCAYPLSSDLALLGRAGGYEIYLPESDQIFGRLLYEWLPADRALAQVEEILSDYGRQSDTLSFAEFAQISLPSPESP